MSFPSYSRVERSVKRIERREKKKEKALLSSRTKLELLLDTIHFDVSMMLLLLFFIVFYGYFIVKITGSIQFFLDSRKKRERESSWKRSVYGLMDHGWRKLKISII